MRPVPFPPTNPPLRDGRDSCPDPAPLPTRLPSRFAAAKIALAYSSLGCLWILGSGWLLHTLVTNPALEASIEMLKGWFFVLCTGAILWLALTRYFNVIRSSAQRLQATEERWKHALDGAGQAVWDWNPRTDQLFISRAWKTMLGFAPDEIGNSMSEWRERLHPEDRDRVRTEIRRHLEGHTVAYASEHRIRCKDGSYKWFLDQGRVTDRAPDGTPLRVVGTRSDVTARKDIEAQVRQWADAFQFCAHGIAMVASDSHHILAANPALAQLLDRPAEDLAATELLSLFAPEDHPRILAAMAESDRSGRSSFEAHQNRPDRSLFPVQVDIVSVHDESECLLYRVATVQDISSRRRAEHQLLLSAEVLRILNDPQALSHATRRILDAIQNSTGIQSVGIRLRHDQDQDQGHDSSAPVHVAATASPDSPTPDLGLGTRPASSDTHPDEETSTDLECACGLGRLSLSGHLETHPLGRTVPRRTPAGSLWTNDASEFLALTQSHPPSGNGDSRAAFASVALIPIRVQDEIVGLLQLNDPRKNVFTAEQIHFFEGLAASFGVALLRHREERAVRRAEQNYRGIFENAVEGIFQAAPDGTVLSANPALASILGLDSPTQLLRVPTEIAPWLPPQPGRSDDFTRRLHKFGFVTNFEAELQRHDGQTVWVSSNVRSVLNASGQVAHYEGTVADITTRKRAEAVLHDRLELQDQLAKVALTVPGMIYSFRLRPDGTISLPFCTPVIEELWGFRPETLRDDFSPALAQIHPEDIDRVRDSITESARTLAPWRDRFRLRHPRKGLLWVEGNSMPRLEPDGSVFWHGFVQDITDRKRVEDELAASRAHLEAALASMTDAIAISDATGRFTHHNRAFATFHRFNEPAQSPQNLADCAAVLELHFPDGDFAHLGQWPTSRALQGEIGINLEYSVRRKDTGERWIGSFSFAPIHAKDGTIVGSVITARDVTELKRVEAALRHSEERYRNLVETTFDWIWETDAEGRYSYVSPKVRDLLGYSPEEVLGRTPFDFMPAEEAARIRAAFLEHAQKRIPFSALENINRHRDGHLVTLETSGVPVLGPQGELRGYRGMDRDVSDRKRLEEQVRQAQKLEAIGQLAGGVAHDFNNILAATMMHLGLLQMNPRHDEETRLALHELEGEARRAAALTRQLLMFSRRSVLKMQPLDLNQVIANLLKMLTRLLGETITLRFDDLRNVPTIEADAGMVEQVVMNLTVNARDAMPKGGRITLLTTVVDIPVPTGATTTTTTTDRRPGRFVCLAVSDTGCGMDDTTRKRIFEPFFTTKEAGKGTGLGLATVHGIVAQHKGWIEVETALGQGTTFRVFFPALVSASVELPHETPPEPVQRGHECILVVEDDPAVRSTVVHSLRALGYHVLQAPNGQAAMTVWRDHAPEVDLLLTDMVMPEGLTGLELTEQLQSQKPTLRAIISSGYSAEIVHAGLTDRPLVVYLPKPYETKTLASTVRSLLDATPAAAVSR